MGFKKKIAREAGALFTSGFSKFKSLFTTANPIKAGLARKVESGKWGKSMLALDAFSVSEGVWSLSHTDFSETNPSDWLFDIAFIGFGVHGIRSHSRSYSTFSGYGKIFSEKVKAHKSVLNAIKAGALNNVHKITVAAAIAKVTLVSTTGRLIKTRIKVLKKGFIIGKHKFVLPDDLIKDLKNDDIMIMAVTMAAFFAAIDYEMDEDVRNIADLSSPIIRHKDHAKEIELLIQRASDYNRVAIDTYFATIRNPFDGVRNIELKQGAEPFAARLEIFASIAKQEKDISHMSSMTSLVLSCLDTNAVTEDESPYGLAGKLEEIEAIQNVMDDVETVQSTEDSTTQPKPQSQIVGVSNTRSLNNVLNRITA